MNDQTRVGIFGGTFDPIHFGHLQVAAIAQRALHLHDLLFLPSHVPLHRGSPPIAHPEHRLAMIKLALQNRAGFHVSELELNAPEPSYTSNTLRRLANQGYTPQQLFFVIGADAFSEISTWRGYPDILDQAHFIVVSRSGHSVVEILRRVSGLDDRIKEIPEDPSLPVDIIQMKLQNPTVFFVQASTPNISSSSLRRQMEIGESVEGFIPPEVLNYIRQQDLYVSSSGKKQF